LVYLQETLSGDQTHVLLQMPLFKIFMFFMFIAGITSWLFVLAQESRHVAQEESSRQNQLLLQEVEAHQQTDAELKRAKEVAEAANLAKSRYLSGISHELRTPLNAILGYAQLLGNDGAVPPARRGAVDVIKRSGEHLSALIDGLLDMAKIEAGKLVLQRNTVNFPEFVDQLVKMFALQAEAKGLSLRLEMSQSLPGVVYTDEKRLRQILINLLSNAIKYTETGFITLRITYHRPLAEFEVRDTGAGIAAEELKRIFEPFERSASAAGIPGTGLGLTIANLLAQVMGGEISVSSVMGEGSVFRVRILLAADSTQMAVRLPEARISGYLGPRRKIGIVDDDPDHRMLMRDTLEPMGFVLFESASGEHCLERLPHDNPELLLLDISMPGLDGWEVVRRIRAGNENYPHIIIVSANAFEGQHLRDETSRSCDFLVKPIVITHLLDLLRRRLALEWITTINANELPLKKLAGSSETGMIEDAHIDELISLGNIGYVRGIESKLAMLERRSPDLSGLLAELSGYVKTFQFKRYIKRLEILRQHEK
jgi:signal transduction histidine kinase/DNA-binding LytR/AlgR family response regulator